MTQHPLLRQAAEAGVSLVMEGGKLRWQSIRPPPHGLLDLMREKREELIDALKPSEGAASLLMFTDEAYAALVEREPDAEEDAERAAIYGRPPPSSLPRASVEASPEPISPSGSQWHPNSTAGRTLALLRTPGAEVVVEREGWLRISTPDGAYAFARQELAERLGWFLSAAKKTIHRPIETIL
jgi:hypothetical protein